MLWNEEGETSRRNAGSSRPPNKKRRASRVKTQSRSGGRFIESEGRRPQEAARRRRQQAPERDESAIAREEDGRPRTNEGPAHG